MRSCSASSSTVLVNALTLGATVTIRAKVPSSPEISPTNPTMSPTTTDFFPSSLDFIAVISLGKSESKSLLSRHVTRPRSTAITKPSPAWE